LSSNPELAVLVGKLGIGAYSASLHADTTMRQAISACVAVTNLYLRY
jgi:hypothetical protein